MQGFGKLYGENVATTDHASEYEELARRIVRLQQHETRLTGILQSGHRLRGGDLLYVQERLFRASVDESLLAQRRADLERDTQVNVVQIEMFEPGTLPPTLSPETPDLSHWFVQAAGLARAHLDRLPPSGCRPFSRACCSCAHFGSAAAPSPCGCGRRFGRPPPRSAGCGRRAVRNSMRTPRPRYTLPGG